MNGAITTWLNRARKAKQRLQEGAVSSVGVQWRKFPTSQYHPVAEKLQDGRWKREAGTGHSARKTQNNSAEGDSGANHEFKGQILSDTSEAWSTQVLTVERVLVIQR